MNNTERFLSVYQEKIHREGADKLLDYLRTGTDFFTAPASTRYHGAHEGGLLEHSLNVRMKEVYGLSYSDESIAIVSLLHDVCKTNFYKVGTRNQKDETGRWVTVPYYTIEDTLPYGHGEKSAYIVSGFLRLTREEAFAIRYHMGFSGTEDPGNVGKALEMFPLAYALVCADMEAAFLMEGKLTPPADAVKP